MLLSNIVSGDKNYGSKPINKPHNFTLFKKGGKGLFNDKLSRRLEGSLGLGKHSGDLLLSPKGFSRDIKTRGRHLQSMLAKYLVPSTGNREVDAAIASNPVKLLRGSFREGMRIPELGEIPSTAMILTEQIAVNILENQASSQKYPKRQEAKNSLNKLLFLDDTSQKTVGSNLSEAIADYNKAMLPIQDSLGHDKLASAALSIAMHNAHLFIVVESLKHVPKCSFNTKG